MKVRNMISKNGNGKAVSQFDIELDNGDRVFQSYDTVIARRNVNGKIILDLNSWDCSITTGRYRNQFLYEKKPATERKIKSGEYALADLNA